MSEQLEPLATEAGQQAIVRAINNLSSLEYAVRAEHAATAAAQSADDALTSATNASNSETKARDWAEKTNGAVETETIVTPPETEGDPPTEELVSYFSAKYWAQMAEDYFSQMTFDTVPTEDSTNGITSGAVYDALSTKQDTLTFDNAPTQNSVNPVKSGGVYSALDTKADKSTTYTKTEVDTALSNVQSTLTFDNVPTANSNNPVKSSGIKTALDGKQDTLTFDSMPTANSNNPVTSGGVYTALQNVNIDIDDEITEDSDNPVTSAAIYAALQNFTPSGGGSGGTGNASGVQSETLYKNDSGINGVNSTITLSKSWKEFDLILIISALANESPTSNKPNVKSHYYFVNKIKQNQELGYGGDVGSRYFSLQFVTDTSLVFTYSNTEKIYEIIGIKFSKNLSEQMYSNVLYENASGWSSGSITLNDSLENYDFIEVLHKLPSDPNTNMNTQFFSTSQLLDTGRYMSITGYASRYFNATVVSSTQLSVASRSDDNIYKIVGYKMAKGGYSGIVSDARMTVKSGTVTTTSNISNGNVQEKDIVFDSPMPDNNYIVLAQTCNDTGGVQYIQVRVRDNEKTATGFRIVIMASGGTINSGHDIHWIAIRPNSYTREGMVEDVLFSNASGVYSGTINLSGNISDYDLIVFETNRSRESNSLNQNRNIFRASSLHELTDNTPFGNCILVTGYGSDYLKFAYVDDNTLNAYEGNNLKLLKIIGIKFGRYVGNVAIDSTVTQNSNAVVTSGAVYDALQSLPTGTGDVTTDTDQNITGTKTFVGSKKVAFKQSTTNDKLGFTLYGNTGTERGYLEFNPTNTVDGVAGLMTLGNYATSAAALTQVGFRRYSNISGASGAYNLLMPMVADARTPFSLTTTYQNFYLPLGFTDGTTTVKTAKSGVVDLSPLLQAAINSITNANGVSY